MVLWTENFQHVENKTFSFAYNLKWLCFAVGLKRTPDHVQVKVSEFFSHKGATHIMSRDTFLSNRKLHFSWGGGGITTCRALDWRLCITVLEVSSTTQRFKKKSKSLEDKITPVSHCNWILRFFIFSERIKQNSITLWFQNYFTHWNNGYKIVSILRNSLRAGQYTWVWT